MIIVRTVGHTWIMKKVGEVRMMDIVEIKVIDMILLFINLALILIRLHMLEKRVKELKGR